MVHGSPMDSYGLLNDSYEFIGTHRYNPVAFELLSHFAHDVHSILNTCVAAEM